MKIVDTFYANIYVGSQEGYHLATLYDDATKSRALKVIQNYCNEVKLGVTVTDTTFYYVEGYEPGLIIGLINYPRFPDTEENIKNKAINLAKLLMKELKQFRISIVMPKETIMIENDDLI